MHMTIVLSLTQMLILLSGLVCDVQDIAFRLVCAAVICVVLVW